MTVASPGDQTRSSMRAGALCGVRSARLGGRLSVREDRWIAQLAPVRARMTVAESEAVAATAASRVRRAVEGKSAA